MNVAHTEDMDDVMTGTCAICRDHECTVASGYDAFPCCPHCECDVRTAYALMARCCMVVDLMYIVKIFSFSLLYILYMRK